MGPTGLRHIRRCTTPDCPAAARPRSDGGYKGTCGACNQKLMDVYNAIVRAVEVGEPITRSAYRALSNERKRVLRDKYAGGTIPTTVFTPNPPLDPKLLRIRRLHRSIYEAADNKQRGLKEGWVYCIIHPIFLGWNSVGKSSDYPARLGSYNRGDPFRRYQIFHKVYFQDRKAAEDIILARCEIACVERRGDWFCMRKQGVASIMDDVFKEVEG